MHTIGFYAVLSPINNSIITMLFFRCCRVNYHHRLRGCRCIWDYAHGGTVTRTFLGYAGRYSPSSRCR